MIKKNDFIKLVSVFTPFILVTIIFGCTSSQSSELKNSSSVAAVSPSVKTQTETQLSEADKAQIIIEILKQENSRDAETRKKETQNIIYILEGNLPVKQIPEIKGIKVTLIKQADIEAKKQSEIVYYEFREFQVKGSKVVMPVIWNKRDSSSGHSAVIEYECEKVSGKWKVEGKVTGVSVSESH